MDNYGIKVDILEDTIKKIIDDGGKPKFIYVIPTGQNPTALQ